MPPVDVRSLAATRARAAAGIHFFAAAEPESAAHSIIASTAAGFGLARELAGPRHVSGVAEEPVPSPDVVAAADHCLQGLEWTVKQS